MSTKMSVPSRGSTRSSVKKCKMSVLLDDLTVKSQEVELKRGIKECLRLIQAENLDLIDTDGLREEILLKPQSGDHLQYELHNYCKKNLTYHTFAPIVHKLAQICYSDHSVSHFASMDRFVGCVYYLTAYFLKGVKLIESAQRALEVAQALELKKEEILNCSEANKDIENFLFNLHSNFTASAIVLASKVQNKSDEYYKLSHKLAMTSLKFFEYANMKQIQADKKFLKTSTLYLTTIKHYNDEDVAQFYNTFKRVYKTVFNKFCELDYLLVLLHKIDKMRGLDTSNGLEMYHHLKRFVHLMSVIMELPSSIKSTLDGVLESFFEPSQFGLYPDEALSKVFLTLSDSKEILCFVLILYCFEHGLQYWWKTYEDDWCKRMSVPLIQKMLKNYLDIFETHFWNTCLFCSPTNSPYKSCYSDLMTGNLHKIQYTIRLCLKNKLPNCISLVFLSHRAFNLSLKCIEIMKRKGCCETQRTYAWKHSVIHHTNTVEDILRQPASDETWFYLMKCSEELIRNLINVYENFPYEFRRIIVLFQRWHHALLKMGKFNDSLFVCALLYVRYPLEEDEIMSMWLQSKSEYSNEIFQETTISEVFKTYNSKIQEFIPNYHISLINMKSALMMEMKAYSFCPSDTFKNSKTSYSLVLRMWRQLEKLNLDIFETSFALTCLVSTNLSGDDDKLPRIFKDKCNDLIDELTKWRREGRKQCRSLLHAANLRFSLFLYNVKMAEISEERMESTQMVLGYLKKVEEEKVKFGEDVDLNLTCNVIPSSSQLTVELETNYLNSLNEIVDLWMDALNGGREEMPKRSEFEWWLQNVKQVAQLYELIGEYQQSFIAWLLFYRIGKLVSCSLATLLGLSHLMKNCSDVDESELKKEADSISEKLRNEVREKNVLMEYWMSLASNYLKNKKSTKCLECLLKGKKILESLRTTVKTYALNARFWCLVNQFLCLYPHYEVEFGYKPGTDLRVMALKAFNYANAGARNDFIKTATQADCTELVLAMLDVNMWAYHLHGVYSQTDFMRFFLDDLYQIVQTLFLPTRTAEVLVRLAEVDMICEKIPECQGKVTKLKSILTTLSSRCSENSAKEKPESPYMPIPKSTSHEKSSPRAISPARFLDKPIDSRELDPSPVHYHLSDVKTSKSSKHVKKCKCRLCQNLLIQVLTMNTLTLEGEMYWMQKSKKAAACYGQAHDTANRLELLRAEQSEILRMKMSAVLRSDAVEFDFRLKWVQFHTARFLIKFAVFEAKTLNTVTDNVKTTIDRVGKIMKKFSYEEKLLLWTFTEVKLLTLVMARGEEMEKKKTKTPVAYQSKTGTKTPFVGQKKATGNTVPKADKISKKPSNVKNAATNDFGEGDSDSDPKNKAFIGLEKLPVDKKAGIQPKKLSFCTTESVSASKTVVKAQKERMSHIKPKKLNLDAVDGEEKDKSNGAKKKTLTEKKSTSSLATRSKKENVPAATGKASVQTTIKIHADSEKERRPRRVLTNSERNALLAAPKKPEFDLLPKKMFEEKKKNSKAVKKDVQNVSMDLFLS